MTESPLVSIGAINYNNAKYILETLESIKKQTYQNIELIIVDDCSTDNSVELISEWLKAYRGSYQFIKHNVNKGVCAACNSGLRNATGKYVSLIGTDDAMVPDKTKVQVEILEETNDDTVGVYSDAWLMDEHSNPIDGLFINIHRKFETNPSGDIFEALLQGNYIPAMSMMFKTIVFEDIGLYDENLVYEDYDMWLRISKRYKIIFSEFISCKYRIRPGSLSSTIRNWDYSDIQIFSKHAGAALPMPRIRAIAHRAYVNNDAVTAELVPGFAANISDEYMATAYLLWKFKIPAEVGEPILQAISHEEVRTPTERISMLAGVFTTNIVSALTAEKQRMILAEMYGGERAMLESVCEAMPLETLKTICADALFSRDAGLIPVIKQMEKRTGSRYLKALRLLWKYKVNVPTSRIILDRINGYCNARILNIYIDVCIYKDIFGAIRSGNTDQNL